MWKYDYLIVGSGLAGAVFAYEAVRHGKTCLVLERRGHIAGNVYDTEEQGILIHRYGAHIFHTAHKEIWDYLSEFCAFNHFVNSPVANYRGEIYNLPFNMNTFSRLWGVVSPEEAIARIADERVSLGREAENLEEQALSLVGPVIYQKLIQGYTEKQWGRPCRELPAFILKRIPLRFTYDNNYFNDPYQGVPVQGYTAVVNRLLQGCEVRINTDFFSSPAKYRGLAHRVFYTGMIDEYFGYRYGPLEYRSLRFEDTAYETPNYQGVAVMNYTDGDTPFTRSIEHKHFQFGTQPRTVVTREYPMTWKLGSEPYYPVNDEKNQTLYRQYQNLAAGEDGVIFCGRLAEYQYYNMDQVVASALQAAQREF